jgi:hypothetical protein
LQETNAVSITTFTSSTVHTTTFTSSTVHTSQMCCTKITLIKQLEYNLQVAMLMVICHLLNSIAHSSLVSSYLILWILTFSLFLFLNEAPQGNMLKSWLGSSAEKLKKQCSEKTCLRGNSDDAGIGHLMIQRCCLYFSTPFDPTYLSYNELTYTLKCV